MVAAACVAGDSNTFWKTKKVYLLPLSHEMYNKMNLKDRCHKVKTRIYKVYGNSKRK